MSTRADELSKTYHEAAAALLAARRRKVPAATEAELDELRRILRAAASAATAQVRADNLAAKIAAYEAGQSWPPFLEPLPTKGDDR